ARAYERNGELTKAAHVLDGIRADKEMSEKAPWWTVAWFTGLVNAQNGKFDAAIKSFQDILNPDLQDRGRRFDFSKDYVVSKRLGATFLKRSQPEDRGSG